MKITTEMLDKANNEGYNWLESKLDICLYCGNKGKSYYIDAEGITGYISVLVTLCRSKNCNKDFKYNKKIKLSEKDLFYLRINENNY